MMKTERLELRLATIKDAPNLLLLNEDEEVTRFTGDGTLKNLTEAEAQITERFIPQWSLYKTGRFIVSRTDGTFIGWCGLRTFPENGEVDLGYRFMKKFWGHGFATEASRAALRYGFEELSLPRIIAKAMPENISSLKVIQKLGMTFRGYVQDPSEPHAFVVYEMMKKDFKP